MSNTLPYRPNVCMLVYNRRGELWVGRRYGADTWQFPQGGVKKKLSLEENVLQELREELGVKRNLLGRPERLKATHRYDFPRTPPHWEGRYRGQSQTFWAVPFLGADHDIDVLRDSHPEFSAWKWCPPEKVLDVVEPLRREGYRAAVAEFIQRQSGQTA